MKKSPIARELANTYPAWSRVRYDEESVGFTLLNALAQPMEAMQKQLIRMKANYYLPTANLDEIDITYRLLLPTDFEFGLDNTDPFNPSSAPPVVSGLIDGTWYDLELAVENELEAFWYDSIPSRASLIGTVSGISDLLLSTTVQELPVTGVWDHHLDGGYVWVECTGGTTYIESTNNDLYRGRIVLEGTTRKGTIESESLIFPWDMKQRSKKEWEKLTYVGAFNIESGVNVEIRSSDFNAPEYISPWNLRYSENRNKIDEFWELDTSSGTNLDRVEYITDEWQQLIHGLVEKQTRESWELTDDSLAQVSGVDMAIQPFTNRVWIICTDKNLHCYDLSEEIAENIALLKDKTPGSHVQIEVEEPSVVLGETIQILPWHARPLKEINKYRIWYQTPTGTKYGLLAGVQVAFTSNFWTVNSSDTISRTVENLISVPAIERGEYLFVIEVEFIDGEEHTEKTIVRVNYKTPLTSMDLSALMSEDPAGIEFDSDQELWIKGQTKYYHFGLHTDVMLVDYAQKILYFKEEYEEVGVDSE